MENYDNLKRQADEIEYRRCCAKATLIADWFAVFYGIRPTEWPIAYIIQHGKHDDSDASMKRILDKSKLLILLGEFNERCSHTKECNVYANPVNGQCICGLNELRNRLSAMTFQPEHNPKLGPPNPPRPKAPEVG